MAGRDVEILAMRTWYLVRRAVPGAERPQERWETAEQLPRGALERFHAALGRASENTPLQEEQARSPSPHPRERFDDADADAGEDEEDARESAVAELRARAASSSALGARAQQPAGPRDPAKPASGSGIGDSADGGGADGAEKGEFQCALGPKKKLKKLLRKVAEECVAARDADPRGAAGPVPIGKGANGCGSLRRLACCVCCDGIFDSHRPRRAGQEVPSCGTQRHGGSVCLLSGASACSMGARTCVERRRQRCGA